jgi:hypothetical protein
MLHTHARTKDKDTPDTHAHSTFCQDKPVAKLVVSVAYSRHTRRRMRRVGHRAGSSFAKCTSGCYSTAVWGQRHRKPQATSPKRECRQETTSANVRKQIVQAKRKRAGRQGAQLVVVILGIGSGGRAPLGLGNPALHRDAAAGHGGRGGNVACAGVRRGRACSACAAGGRWLRDGAALAGSRDVARGKRLSPAWMF